MPITVKTLPQTWVSDRKAHTAGSQFYDAELGLTIWPHRETIIPRLSVEMTNKFLARDIRPYNMNGNSYGSSQLKVVRQEYEVPQEATDAGYQKAIDAAMVKAIEDYKAQNPEAQKPGAEIPGMQLDFDKILNDYFDSLRKPVAADAGSKTKG